MNRKLLRSRMKVSLCSVQDYATKLREEGTGNHEEYLCEILCLHCVTLWYSSKGYKPKLLKS
jgi:hypothetical protein